MTKLKTSSSYARDKSTILKKFNCEKNAIFYERIQVIYYLSLNSLLLH